MTVRAAIDVGSNSVKLLVLSIDANGGYHITHDEARVTGLGAGLGDSGVLDEETRMATAICIADFANTAREFGAISIRAAGTSALRRAADRESFVAQVRTDAGIELEIISGDEEARLARVVALRELPGDTRDVLLFDVGGGSTELTLCVAGKVQEACSLELGARRLTEQASVSHPVVPSMADRMEAVIAIELRKVSSSSAHVQLAGLGGTATTLIWMMRGLAGDPPGDPHLAECTLPTATELLTLLAGRTMREMVTLPGLDPARAGVIHAGITIIVGVMKHYSAERFTLVDRGLRFGLLLG